MSEKYYDEVIAPALLDIAKKCEEKGMSLVANVEYEKEKRAGTFNLPESAGLAMRMQYMCCLSGENVDGYIIALKKYCAEKRVDISSSIFLNI